MNSHSMIHFQLFLLSFLLFASFINTDFLALPGCPEKCGNLSIPFPFGITSDCYLDDSFLITCNSSFNPPKPFFQLWNAEVLSISLDGKIKILNSSLELMGLEERERKSVPMVIDWVAGNVTCHVARNDKSSNACQSLHSQCKDSRVGRGHVCHCLPGYQGNPYLVDGCRDINESAVSKPCKCVCINLRGSFKCCCPKGFTGDGNWSASIYFPIGIFILAPVLASTLIVWIHNKKNHLKQRTEIFEQNGGNLLRKKLSYRKRSAGNLLMRKLSRRKKPATQLRLYTAEDIKNATNNYSEKRVTQRCNPGTFYRGTLDNTEVVIMSIERMPKSQIEQFIDELIFLSRPHMNLVRVLGCCLETFFPFVVYELHGDGNRILLDCIQDVALVPQFSCEVRVKVATEAARGLAYLQSHNPRASFVHGDICSANILLNNSYEAKIFYAAASSPVYQDPQFSGQLDETNDVYSFGVVLAELVTGGMEIAPGRHENDGNLALEFIQMAKKSCLINKRDAQLMNEVAMLAERCLSERPGKRPKMKEVEAKLSALLQLK